MVLKSASLNPSKKLPLHTYTHIHSIDPVSAGNLQLDIEHVNKLGNTEHI
jgi:hypothetical protein